MGQFQNPLGNWLIPREHHLTRCSVLLRCVYYSSPPTFGCAGEAYFLAAASQPPEIRVAVFIDWHNAYKSARDQFGMQGMPNEHGNFNPLRLAELLAYGNGRGAAGKLVRLEIHRGLPNSNKDPIGHGANRRQAAAWVKDDEKIVIPRLRPLRYPANWPEEPPQEKGVDVQLVMGLTEMLLTEAIDVGIVLSRDTDMLPAFETLCRLRGVGCVETAAFAKLNDGRMKTPKGMFHHRSASRSSTSCAI